MSHRNKDKWALALAASFALTLVACGGGGGEEDEGPDLPDDVEETGPAMIEGAWTGTALHMNTASARPAVLIATRDGDTMLYIQRGVDSAVVRGDACCDGLVEGSGDGWTLVNQTRTAAPVRFLITDLVNGQRALTGPVTVEGQVYELDLRRHADYQQPLSLASLAGSYTLTTAAGPRVTFDITPTGALTATDVVGCQFAAQLSVPDVTRNLFVIPSLTMTGCTGGATVRNGTYSGLGYLAGLADPQAPKLLTFMLSGNLVYAMALPGALEE